MIIFDRTWKKKDILDVLNENEYPKFEEFKDLKALVICPYAEDECEYDADYKELIYVVPKKWLKKTVKKLFGVTNLRNWLKYEYSTEESGEIFEKALNEKKVVMVTFI